MGFIEEWPNQMKNRLKGTFANILILKLENYRWGVFKMHATHK